MLEFHMGVGIVVHEQQLPPPRSEPRAGMVRGWRVPRDGLDCSVRWG
ncbi:hypothetical protein AB0B12_03705 [Streptomyces sp. NPDC044780]